MAPANPRQNSDAHLMAVLQFFCQSAQVPIDPTGANQALRQAIRNIPPTHSRAGVVRLQQASEQLGVKLLCRQFTVQEALNHVKEVGPLAVYTISDSGLSRWFVIERSDGKQAQLKKVHESDTDDWLSVGELAQLLGADQENMLDWQIPQPSTPMSIESASEVAYFLRPQSSAHGHAHDHHHMSPFRRMISFMRFENRELFIVILFAVGVGIFSLATPIAVMSVVNSIALVNVGQQLIVMCLVLFLALGLAGFLQFMQSVTVEFIQRRLFVRVAEELSYRLPRVDVSAFDEQHGPELVNRFFDVLTVQKAAATLLLDGVTILLQILIGMLLLGYYHELLLGFDLILIASLMFLFFVLGWGGTRTAVAESIAKYRVAGWMEEVARHPLVFKTDGGPQFAMERTDNLTREYLLARAAHFRVLMRQIGFALLLQASANAGLLAMGGYLVIMGKLTLGELVAAELVVTMVVATFAKLGKQIEAYFDMYAAVDKVGHLLDLPLERNGGIALQHRTGGLSLKLQSLKFSYGHDHSVIQNLSMEIKAGERVALMGPNGVGKSTLMDIIFGLRTPTSGSVEIDGHDLRDYGLDLLRQDIAMVDRIEVFEGSVLENLRMGRHDISFDDVRSALERVGLLQSVMSLPEGLNTPLWPGGSPLSLGQANRLMLARAVLGQPRLLILDETLDNMDPSLRAKVLPAILGPGLNWTLIVVTHSEEVAKLCTRTIRLEAHDDHHDADHHKNQVSG
jgi:putative ABC transport system ATP-binding protein